MSGRDEADVLSLAGGVRGMKVDQAKLLKDPEKENKRLRTAMSDLTLDKLIFAEVAKGNS